MPSRAFSVSTTSRSLSKLSPLPTTPLDVLDFDIEARPLTYLGGDFTTRDITAIAASWVGLPDVYVWVLGECTYVEMLEGFRELYDRAGIVTGHYIRRYDLPNLNGAMIEHGLPPLGGKLTSDTKADLVKRAGISVSQESLADMLGVPAGKHHMSQAKWRSANRLDPDGIAETMRRVTDDVRQHKQLRAALLERGLLGPPRRWAP